MKNLSLILFTFVCFSSNLFSYEDFEMVEKKGCFLTYNQNSEIEIIEAKGVVPVSKDLLGLDGWMENYNHSSCQFTSMDEAKQALWRMYDQHLKCAEINMQCAYNQSLLIPDNVHRQLMSAALKTALGSMQHVDIKKKLAIVTALLVEQYLECVFDQYEKIQAYVKQSRDQYELAIRYLHILSLP